MRAEIKTSLEEMMAKKETIEIVAEHYKGISHTEAMRLLTALPDRALTFYMKSLKE
jgi:hypothetical protein